jgi:hypothetical protein
MEATRGPTPLAKSWKQFRGNKYYQQQELQLDAHSKELQTVAKLLQEQVAEQQLRASTLQELVLQQEAICAAMAAFGSPSATAPAFSNPDGSYTQRLLMSAPPQLWHKVSNMTPKVRLWVQQK